MKTVTGKVVTTKPISYSNAAKYSSRFTSSDNGASAALDIFLHCTTESFNNLVGLRKQFKARPRCQSHAEITGENQQGEKAEKRERMKDDNKYGVEGGKKRKQGEDVKNLDMADDQSGKKKKRMRKIEGEGK